VFLTASKPRQIIVDTEELSSRTDVLRPEACSWPARSDQFASTSSSSGVLARSTDDEAAMGIGREENGESLRVSAAWT
jgi:hypothetical protein